MAETRISDVIVPEIFTDYTMEPTIYRSRFWRSGVLEQNAGLNNLLDGGGKTFNLPFWQDTAGTSGDVPSETVDTTINNITADKQVARRQNREKAWGQNALSAILAGSEPLESAASRVMDYWAQAYDIISIKSLEGVVADNIANDSGDLVNDISGLTGGNEYFSDDGVIDTQALLGENGTVGSMDSADYTAILVHPKTYAYMRKLDLIDFEPVSEQVRSLGTYMGMTVIVDRNATLATDVYSTYIFKTGALQYGFSSARYEPTEVYRQPGRGFGTDELYTRRVTAIHPVGFAWTDASVAGTSPTDAELADAANWDRVYKKENSGFVVFKHKLP